MKERLYNITTFTTGLVSLLLLKGAGVTTQTQAVFLIFGLSLFISFAGARFLSSFGLPAITTYLLVGMLLGPDVLDIFHSGMVNRLYFVDQVALSLIALVAGGEIHFRSEHINMGRIAAFVTVQMLITFSLFFAIIWFAAPHMNPYIFSCLAPFVFLSIIANATSPSTTVAIIIETGAKGNLASTVLTSAIMKDIIIIIAFTASLSLFGTAKSEASILGVIIEETFSIIAGIGAGLVLITYVRHVRQNRGVFLLMFTAIITWLAGEIHLNPLLTFLAAGITVNNFSIFGKSLVQDVENNSQIIYLVFFFLAGALIDMDALSRMWLLAVFIVILRAATMHAGCYASSYMVKCGRKAMTLSSLGFIGQAGVSIGFAKIIGANFPGWGEDFRTMLLAVVAINQIIGPVGFKWALKKAGEIKG